MLHGGGIEGSEPLGLSARAPGRGYGRLIIHSTKAAIRCAAGTDTGLGREGVRAELVPGLSGADCKVRRTLAAKDKCLAPRNKTGTRGSATKVVTQEDRTHE